MQEAIIAEKLSIAVLAVLVGWFMIVTVCAWLGTEAEDEEDIL